MRVILFLVLLNVLPGINNSLVAEEPEKVIQMILENKDLISSTAKLFNVRSRLVAAIIYTEWTLNVNWMESQLDILLAKTGYSSSIGLGQVKIHTAQWIEKKLFDSTSKYFLGSIYQAYLPKSKSRDEIISKLNIPAWNIYYVTAYIAMFCKRWRNAGFCIEEKPNIVGTLYSLGPYRINDGSERVPNINPKSNHFGQVVAEFYYSNKLIEIFPLNINANK